MGDEQRHRRIEPPRPEEGVPQQADQQRSREVGAQQVLLALARRGGRADPAPDPLLRPASSGMTTTLDAASAIPTMLSSGCVPFTRARTASTAT